MLDSDARARRGDGATLPRWFTVSCVLLTQAVSAVACSNESQPEGDFTPRSGAGGANTPGGSGGAMGGSAAGAGAVGGVAPTAGVGAMGGAAGGSEGGAVASQGGTSDGGVSANPSAGTAGALAAGASGSGGTAGLSSAGGGGTSGSGGAAAGTGGSSGGADSGKVVLFDGTDLDAWQSMNGGGAVQWRLIPEAAAMEVVPGTGNIVTKQKFGSMLLHIEYWTPALSANVTGQSRGNSGIYVKRAYEFQVLDSFGLPPADDTCGAIYKTKVPLVSACFGAEMWNTYEIEFRDSVWNAQGTKTEPAVAVSVHLNGQLVHQNVRLTIDPTQAGTPDAAGPQPLMLQDHDPQGKVRYRNIWIIPRTVSDSE